MMEISQNYLEYFENTTDISVFSGHSESGDRHISKLVLLCIFIPFSFACVFENFRVLSIVFTMPAKKRRPGDLLIAHLCLIHILAVFVAGDYVLYKFGNVNLVEMSWVSCAMRSYIRNVMSSVLPMNVAAINYEKTRAFRNAYYHGGKFLVGRCISAMWILAVLVNVPNIFTVKFSVMGDGSISKCKEQYLFESMWITTSYEFLKLIVFNAIPIGYIVQTLVLIRFVVYKYIIHSKKVLTDEIKRKRYNVKLVFANAIVFVLFWLPQGLLLFAYKIHNRLNLDGKQNESKGNIKHTKPDDNVKTTIFYAVLVVIFFTYVTVSPLIHLHLNTHMNNTKWYQFTFQRKKVGTAKERRNRTIQKGGDSARRGRLQARNRNPSNEDLHNAENIRLRDVKISVTSNEIYATSVISRISTFQYSTSVVETPRNSEILDDVEIFV